MPNTETVCDITADSQASVARATGSMWSASSGLRTLMKTAGETPYRPKWTWAASQRVYLAKSSL